TGTPARFARVWDVLARPTTARARAREHDEPTLRGYLPASPALRAGLRRRARPRSRPLALVAGRAPADGHLVPSAAHRVREADLGVHPYVLPSVGAAPPRARLPAEAPEAAEEVGEHVLEVAEDIVYSDAGEIHPRPIEAGVTE